MINPATKVFPWPSLTIDTAKLRTLLQACVTAGVTYKLGGKAPSLTAKPGKDFDAIDCSGFVRWALYGSTVGAAPTAGIAIPDGSVNQHDWADEKGFKKSSVDAGKLADGAVRIAFLSPAAGGGVGHVVLLYGGKTIESHGHHGPDSRPWTGDGWQGHCAVYVLAPPAKTK